jgi:hypothetical protein
MRQRQAATMTAVARVARVNLNGGRTGVDAFRVAGRKRERIGRDEGRGEKADGDNEKLFHDFVPYSGLLVDDNILRLKAYFTWRRMSKKASRLRFFEKQRVCGVGDTGDMPVREPKRLSRGLTEARPIRHTFPQRIPTHERNYENQWQ